MKMVSAAKLHKSEENTLRFIPYKQKLTDMLTQYLSNIEPGSVSIPLAEKREVKRAAIVCISSNSGLCGVFNSSVNKLLNEAISNYQAKNVAISIYPIGKKIADYVNKLGYPVSTDYNYICDKPTYEETCKVVQPLVEAYIKKEIDELIAVANNSDNDGDGIKCYDQQIIDGFAEKDASNKIYRIYFLTTEYTEENHFQCIPWFIIYPFDGE